MRRRSARLLARASESEDDGAECVKFEIKQTPCKEDNLGRERPKSKSKKDTSTPSSTTKRSGRTRKIIETKIIEEDPADLHDGEICDMPTPSSTTKRSDRTRKIIETKIIEEDPADLHDGEICDMPTPSSTTKRSDRTRKIIETKIVEEDPADLHDGEICDMPTPSSTTKRSGRTRKIIETKTIEEDPADLHDGEICDMPTPSSTTKRSDRTRKIIETKIVEEDPADLHDEEICDMPTPSSTIERKRLDQVDYQKNEPAPEIIKDKNDISETDSSSIPKEESSEVGSSIVESSKKVQKRSRKNTSTSSTPLRRSRARAKIDLDQVVPSIKEDLPMELVEEPEVAKKENTSAPEIPVIAPVAKNSESQHGAMTSSSASPSQVNCQEIDYGISENDNEALEMENLASKTEVSAAVTENAEFCTDHSLSAIPNKSKIQEMDNGVVEDENQALEKGNTSPQKGNSSEIALENSASQKEQSSEIASSAEKESFAPKAFSPFQILSSRHEPSDLKPSAKETSTISLGNKHEDKLFSKSRKLAKKYNFSLSGSQSGEKSLVKLTSDIFKNMPFKLSKEDLVSGVSSKVKTQENDVHNLDMISLSTDGDKETKAKDPNSLSSELDPKIDASDLYFDMSRGKAVEFKQKKKKKKKEHPVMKKSVLPSDLEKLESAPKVNVSMTQKMKKRKEEKGETAGPGWFNLPKTEMTEELKKDLQVIKMRNILDSKRFYKKADKKMPKYFQVGTVIEGATEFYSSRISKKDRKRTLVDELLEDSEFRKKNKRKYLEIQSKKESGGKKYYKRMKNKGKATWAKD